MNQQVVEVPDKPWMHQSEINLIIAFLDTEHDMLEWGCGGSTILFSQYVANYTSIEHNKEWYSQVTAKVKNRNLSNVTTNWVPNNNPNGVDWPSTSITYKDYIEQCWYPVTDDEIPPDSRGGKNGFYMNFILIL